MLQTVLVYLSLTVIMLFLSNRRGRGQWFGVSLAVLLYAIVFGVRYGVGTDYFGYLYYYKLAQTSLSEFDSYEAGFNFLINLFAGEGAHFSVFFGAIAFLQLFLICFSLRKHKEIISYMFFVFMMACVWLSFSNGIRQELAFCFFIVAIFCLSTKRKWLYFFFVMFAYLMHKSAIILIAFYPLFIWKKEWFVDVKKQLIALCVAIVLMNFSLVGSVVGLLDNLIISLGYEEYMKDKPIPRSESIVTKSMFVQILIGALYITALCLAILFVKPLRDLFGDVDATYLKSAVFATFMMAITFNGFNARTAHLNPFEGLGRNRNFILVMCSILVLQYLFVTFGGKVLSVEPLTWKTWGICALLAFLVIPIDMIRKLVLMRKSS